MYVDQQRSVIDARLSVCPSLRLLIFCLSKPTNSSSSSLTGAMLFCLNTFSTHHCYSCSPQHHAQSQLVRTDGRPSHTHRHVVCYKCPHLYLIQAAVTTFTINSLPHCLCLRPKSHLCQTGYCSLQENFLKTYQLAELLTLFDSCSFIFY